MSYIRMEQGPSGATATSPQPFIVGFDFSDLWNSTGVIEGGELRRANSSKTIVGSVLQSRQLIKRNIVVSGSGTTAAHIIDYQKVLAERSALRRWAEIISDDNSDAFGENGELLIPARLALETALIERGDRALKLLVDRFMSSRVSGTSLYAVCDAMGRVQANSARLHALTFLTTLLKHPRTEGRDAAVLGLALLDDARCIPALKAALDSELSKLLRETISDVISSF